MAEPDDDLRVDREDRARLPRTAERASACSISAGGTREAIDPVRVISNRSSGRQGYALAEVARRVSAPTVTLVIDGRARRSRSTWSASIDVVHVESARPDARRHARAIRRRATAPSWPRPCRDFTVDGRRARRSRRTPACPTLHLELHRRHRARPRRGARRDQVVVAFAAETTNVDGERARETARARTSICWS